jgi:hypothetical protein
MAQKYLGDVNGWNTSCDQHEGPCDCNFITWDDGEPEGEDEVTAEHRFAAEYAATIA